MEVTGDYLVRKHVILVTLLSFNLIVAALGVQQPSLLGASPTIYTQQTALAAAGLTTQTPANYQLTQTAALQQQAAAVLQQVSLKVMSEVIQ